MYMFSDSLGRYVKYIILRNFRGTIIRAVNFILRSCVPPRPQIHRIYECECQRCIASHDSSFVYYGFGSRGISESGGVRIIHI
jgi:hypothetical protein